MMSTSRQPAFLRPATIVIVAVVWGVLFAYIDGVVSPHVNDATSLSFQTLMFFGLAHSVFLYATLVACGIFLLRRKWISALSYFAAACLTYASDYGSLALRDDRFAFPGRSHREIADIYEQRQSEFDLTNPIPHLVALDAQCHPPTDCECWVLLDSGHTSGVEGEMRGWHPPTASIFPRNTTPEHFAIINVERLESGAYSIMGCDFDLTAWWVR
jgi:hypothetical protein